eukprot:scaffold227223_cov33-Tisochrysis_lutea.AAC.3
MATKTAFRTSVLSLCSPASESRRASAFAVDPNPRDVFEADLSASFEDMAVSFERPAHADPTSHQRPRSSACTSSSQPA